MRLAYLSLLSKAAVYAFACVLVLSGAQGQGRKQQAAAAENPFESGKPFEVKNAIDRCVADDLKKLGLSAAAQCSDAVFLRRIYLDVTGKIPTVTQVKAFLQDKDPEKRGKLIDALLESPAHARYWAMKWGDLLRIKAEFPINLWPNAAQAYDSWVYEAMLSNMPFDRFARALLTSSGSNFREPPVNFYRAIQGRTPEAIASSVTLVFLGERADRINPDRLARLSEFFQRVAYKSTNEWKEEIVYCDPCKTGEIRTVFPDGQKALVKDGEDPRVVFADWLIRPKNMFFARTFVNRTWNWIFGLPLYESVDNLSMESKAVNPALARHLILSFEKSGFDNRALLREIFNSSVYQQSSLADASDARVLAHFGTYPIRPLEAEPLIDAICQITGTTEVYTSTTPEPYTTLPTCEDAVAIPDGSITTAFLNLFGRSPRDSGLDAERERGPNAGQRMHLLNSSHIRNKLERGKYPQVTSQVEGKESLIVHAFLRVLSRYPTKAENELLRQRDPKDAKKMKHGIPEIYWALINSEEFLNRH